MELIKPTHKPARRIGLFGRAEVAKIAQDLVTYIDENNKVGFKGKWKDALAISHCQVADPAFNMFVVAEHLATDTSGNRKERKKNRKSWLFPSRVILNAEIIKAHDHLERVVPMRNTVREGKEVRVELVPTKALVSNMIKYPEACMSYPFRSEKKVERFSTIKVRYQVLRKVFGFYWLSTYVEEVDKLKAHLFQHEVDHALGIDICHGDGKSKAPERPYATKVELPKAATNNDR